MEQLINVFAGRLNSGRKESDKSNGKSAKESRRFAKRSTPLSRDSHDSPRLELTSKRKYPEPTGTRGKFMPGEGFARRSLNAACSMIA